MKHPTLIIGNKCYSTWSLRPWLLMKTLKITFEEIVIPLDTPDTRSSILKHSPSGKVPCLIDGDITVWESLAIMEYIAEKYPSLHVWPADVKARVHARSASNEMHAGFMAMRKAMPMNLGKKYPEKNRGEDARNDISRITTIWKEARDNFGKQAGQPFLYGAFSAADAMFAPVVTRLYTYSIPVDPEIKEYMSAVMELEAFKVWLSGALAEKWIVPADEIDEAPTENFREIKSAA